MWYFRSMDAMGIYVITTRIMILLYFTMTKNQVLLMHPSMRGGKGGVTGDAAGSRWVGG